MGATVTSGSPPTRCHVMARPRARAATILLLAAALAACDRPAAREARPDNAAGAPEGGRAPSAGTRSAAGLIVFNSASEEGIAILDPATGQLERLAEGFSAEWSWDGTTISFMRDARIFLVAADGSGEREVGVEPFHFEPPYVVRPVLSPDGRRVAYSRQGDIEVLDLERPSPVFLVPPGPEDDRMPAWSPSGREIAFVRDRDIYVVEMDGSGLRNLTKDAAGNLDPDWSPDGVWIAYSSTRDGDSRIWRIRAEGTDRRRLTGDRGADHQEYHPSWSPDGAEVVFERWGDLGMRAADIYAATVEAGVVRPLVVAPGFDGQPSWGAGARELQRRTP